MEPTFTYQRCTYGHEVRCDFRVFVMTLCFSDRYIREQGKLELECLDWRWNSAASFPLNHVQKRMVADLLKPKARECVEQYVKIRDANPYVPALCGKWLALSLRGKHEAKCPDCRYEMTNVEATRKGLSNSITQEGVLPPKGKLPRSNVVRQDVR